MRLETVDVAIIAIYYGVLILAGSVTWLMSMHVYDNAPSVPLISAVNVATSTSLVAASLFYTRKLYKDIFAALSPDYKRENTSRLATVIYYVARPLFASFISILTVVLLYEFVRAMSVGHVGVSFNFLLFTTVSAALIAIVTGVAVERIEKVARHSDTVLRPPF